MARPRKFVFLVGDLGHHLMRFGRLRLKIDIGVAKTWVRVRVGVRVSKGEGGGEF